MKTVLHQGTLSYISRATTTLLLVLLVRLFGVHDEDVMFVWGSGFPPISNPPTNLSTIDTIVINPSCTNQDSKFIPLTMFTIRPSDSTEAVDHAMRSGTIGGSTVSVETSPTDLLTVNVIKDPSSSSSELHLKWNNDVASTTKEGGVIIHVPSYQLKRVEVSGGWKTQIFNGFTSMQSIDVSGGAECWASLPNLNDIINVDVSGGAILHLDTNVNVKEANVSGGSKAFVKTPMYDDFTVTGGSQAFIDGDLGGISSNVSGGASVTSTGYNAGTIDVSGGAQVFATNCDGVTTSGGASCIPGNYTVLVDTSEQPLSMRGTAMCLDEDWSIEYNEVANSGSDAAYGTGGFHLLQWVIGISFLLQLVL